MEDEDERRTSWRNSPRPLTAPRRAEQCSLLCACRNTLSALAPCIRGRGARWPPPPPRAHLHHLDTALASPRSVRPKRLARRVENSARCAALQGHLPLSLAHSSTRPPLGGSGLLGAGPPSPARLLSTLVLIARRSLPRPTLALPGGASSSCTPASGGTTVAGRRCPERARARRTSCCAATGRAGTGGAFSLVRVGRDDGAPRRRLARGVVGENGSGSCACSSAAWSTAAPATDEMRLTGVGAVRMGERGRAGPGGAAEGEEEVGAAGRAGGSGGMSSLLGRNALRRLAVDLRSLRSPLRIVPVLLAPALEPAVAVALPAAESVSLAEAADVEVDSARGLGFDLDRARPCDRPRLCRWQDEVRGSASVEEEAVETRSSGAVAKTGAGLGGSQAEAECDGYEDEGGGMGGPNGEEGPLSTAAPAVEGRRGERLVETAGPDDSPPYRPRVVTDALRLSTLGGPACTTVVETERSGRSGGAGRSSPSTVDDRAASGSTTRLEKGAAVDEAKDDCLRGRAGSEVETRRRRPSSALDVAVTAPVDERRRSRRGRIEMARAAEGSTGAAKLAASLVSAVAVERRVSVRESDRCDVDDAAAETCRSRARPASARRDRQLVDFAPRRASRGGRTRTHRCDLPPPHSRPRSACS